MPNFGELLRRLRGDRSQRQVAAELEMPVTTLSTLENQQTVPRGPVLRKLAGHYGVSVSYFYSSSATEMKPTGSASAWLKTVRQDSNVKETIATYAAPDYSDEIKSKIAEKIAEKMSDRKRGDKTSYGNKT
jgi:transcriptional regulator with XRE-family HTH domain